MTAIAAALIGVGCLILSVLEGWVGILLWALTAPLVAAGIDLAFRTEVKPQRPDRPRPAMMLRVTRRPGPASKKRAEPERFVWHSGGSSRRRSR
jgi:hypothetical protein